MKKPSEKTLKKIYKILSVVLFACWISFGVTGVYRCAVKQYVYPLYYKEEIVGYADEFGLERALVFAVIKVESGFNAAAVSNKGAVGLMQITESTGNYIAGKLGESEHDLTDPDTNVKYGCYYLRYLIEKFGNTDTAIVAYNAGEGNVQTWLGDVRYSDDGVTLKTVPFNESREYYIRIKKSFEKYKKLYYNILDKI